MKIEQRRGQEKYVYKYETTDGKTRKRYVGSVSDPAVDILVRADQLNKANSSAARAAVESESDKYDQLEPLIRLLATRIARCVQRQKEKLERESVKRQMERLKPREPLRIHV